jgi:NTP pyrophosphatase (non-canonical NTP hydrolase)
LIFKIGKSEKWRVFMSRTFQEMEKMYEEVVKRFNKIELRAWNAEGAMIELSKQVGELAKQVMIKERYYALEGEVPDVDERLGNEMADVVAQVMRLTDFYKIDLEKAFIEAREDEDRYLKSRGV